MFPRCQKCQEFDGLKITKNNIAEIYAPLNKTTWK